MKVNAEYSSVLGGPWWRGHESATTSEVNSDLMSSLNIDCGLWIRPQHPRQRSLLELEIGICQFERILVNESRNDQLRNTVRIVSARTDMSTAREGSPSLVVIGTVRVTPALWVKVVWALPIIRIALHRIRIDGYFHLFLVNSACLNKHGRFCEWLTPFGMYVPSISVPGEVRDKKRVLMVGAIRRASLIQAFKNESCFNLFSLIASGSVKFESSSFWRSSCCPFARNMRLKQEGRNSDSVR